MNWHVRCTACSNAAILLKTLNASPIVRYKLFPELKIKTPPKMPKWMLQLSAASMEYMSKFTDKEPMLLKSQVRMYFKVRQDMDISKSEQELGYKPAEPLMALQRALKYLHEHPEIKYQ